MAYSEELIGAVWQSARGLYDVDPEIWRQDMCGAWIRRDHYGSADSDFGWKIVNVSPGEPDVAQHLRALHHANDYDRANRRSVCRMRADDDHVPASTHSRAPRNRAV